MDLEVTQRAKREALAASGVDQSHVTFVEVDFTKESWLDKLEAAGFDRSVPAVVVWEGVNFFLPAEAVETTVDMVKRCAPGTVLALDYFADEVICGQLLPNLARTTKFVGEPFAYGMGASADPDLALSWTKRMGLKLRHEDHWGPRGEPCIAGGALAAEVI